MSWFASGFGILITLLYIAALIFLLYWIIRLAVKHAIAPLINQFQNRIDESSDTASRLSALQNLNDRRLIADGEYQQQRAVILKDI